MDTTELTPLTPPAADIRAFWQDFNAMTEVWAVLDVRERVEALNEWLEQRWPGLSFELYGADEGVMGLVLTAHGVVERFPLLLALVREAPTLPGYALEAFRARSCNDDFGIRMDGFNLAASDLLLSHYAESGQVGLTIAFTREIEPEYQDHARNMAFIMLDHIIGEYDFAVKVGSVEFVDSPPTDLPPPISLQQFVPVFDAFWANELGHSNVFPHGEHDWRGLEVRFTPDDAAADTALLSLNDSAKAVAMRADLAYTLSVSMSASTNPELEQAHALEDALSYELERHESGILAYSMLRAGQRHALFYVGNPEVAAAQARLQLSKLGVQAFTLRSAADFRWASYYEFAS